MAFYLSMLKYGADVPSMYEKVKYIESNGTQEILLGNALANMYALTYDIKFIPTALSSTVIHFGCKNGDGSFQFPTSSSKIFQWVHGGGTFSSVPLTVGTEIVISQKNYNVTISSNGSSQTVNFSSLSSTVINSNLYCFNKTGQKSYASDKLESVVVKDADGNLLINAYPVVHISKNVAGMYDSVSKTFYGNIGTGTLGWETMDGTYVAPVKG